MRWEAKRVAFPGGDTVPMLVGTKISENGLADRPQSAGFGSEGWREAWLTTDMLAGLPHSTRYGLPLLQLSSRFL